MSVKITGDQLHRWSSNVCGNVWCTSDSSVFFFPLHLSRDKRWEYFSFVERRMKRQREGEREKSWSLLPSLREHCDLKVVSRMNLWGKEKSERETNFPQIKWKTGIEMHSSWLMHPFAGVRTMHHWRRVKALFKCLKAPQSHTNNLSVSVCEKRKRAVHIRCEHSGSRTKRHMTERILL